MDAWSRKAPTWSIRHAAATAATARSALIGALAGVLPAAQRRTLAYAARTMLAIGLALFVSFSLQLQSPMSSVVTVLIVANPNTGALVSKSLWRLFGTVLGAAVAVVLMAAFAQSPLLFTVALSLCIGAACAVSSLLRYFRAYGAVLAGYTIIIVASGSFAQPLDIFIGALSRVSAVSVGIVSAALVFLLAARPATQAAAQTLAGTVEGLVRDIARGFVSYRDPDAPPQSDDPARLLRPALLERGAALDEAIEYAGADSYALRRRMGRLRLGTARLLGLLSAMEPLHPDLPRASAEADEARRTVWQVMAALSGLPPQGFGNGLGASLPRIEAARDRLAALAGTVREPTELSLVLHERDALDQLAHAVGDLTGGGAADARIRLPPYLEWAAAGRNSLRGFLVTLLGGLAWYVTQWTAGPVMLSFLVPAACLLSTNPSASRASVEFATGTIAAIGASALCQSLLLPRISGFPLLWGALCLCLAPGIWLQFNPVHRNRAFAYVVFFTAMVSVRNPITFDDIALFNGWLAYLLGALCLVMVFRVLLPANPEREVRRLAASLGRAVELLSSQPGWRRPPPWAAWQNQQTQKILRLILRLQQVPSSDAAALARAAFVVVALGRTVLALRRLRQDPDLPEAARGAAAEALRALRRVRADPQRAAARLEAVQQALAAAPHGPAEDPADVPADAPADTHVLLQLIGAVGEAALLVRRAGGLLGRECPLLGPAAVPVG